MAVECVGMDVLVKFGVSMSKASRAIRLSGFVSNERTWARSIAKGRNRRVDEILFMVNSNKYVFT